MRKVKCFLIMVVATMVSVSCTQDSSNFDNETQDGRGNWPRFMGNNGNTGFVESNIPKNNPKQTHIGDYVSAISEPYEYPTVIKNTLIVGSEGGRFWTNMLHSIDLTSGVENWRIRYDNQSTPTIFQNSIFLSGSYGEDADQYNGNYFYSVDLSSGLVNWKYSINNSYGSNAMVSNNIVVFLTSYGEIFAFNFDSGEIIWKKELENIDGVKNPALSNETIYVGANSSLLAIDLFTGMTIWESEVDAPIDKAPIVSDNKVIIKEYGSYNVEGHIYVFNASNGNELWKSPIGTYNEGSLAVGYGKIFSTNNDNLELSAFNLINGQKVWNVSRSDLHLSWNNNMAISNGMVLLSGSDFLYSFDVNSGEEIWKTETWGTENPIIVGDKILMYNFDSFYFYE